MGIVNNVLAGASGQAGYFLDRSLRFRSSASAYLNRTPASAGNRKTFTYSVWLKRGTLGSQCMFFGDALSNSYFAFNFNSDNTLRVFNNNAGVNTLNLTTTQVFRDVSAWYHFVVSIDTTKSEFFNSLIL